MPRLILLNGPPGIGKSTLAERYADDHPGTLNLDIDTLRNFVGGWRERFVEAGDIVRPLVGPIISVHLQGGRDVIVPQYVGTTGTVEAMAARAHENRATFCEIVLMDGKQEALRRFAQRDSSDDREWHRYVQRFVRENGGDTLLSEMYDELVAAVRTRPAARVLGITAGDVEHSYTALLAALASVPQPSTSDVETR